MTLYVVCMYNMMYVYTNEVPIDLLPLPSY
jgi:hypothetical protein